MNSRLRNRKSTFSNHETQKFKRIVTPSVFSSFSSQSARLKSCEDMFNVLQVI